MSSIEEGIRPTFGGHEKFVFRHGWLKKGVDAVKTNPHVFTDDQALVTLGVGKNMVRSIRHWCLATGLVAELVGSGRTRSLYPTPLATKLLSENGWDPYLEDTGSLWLIHWQLVSHQTRSLVWHLTFSTYLVTEFTKKSLSAFLSRQFEHTGIRTTSGTIEREVDCCLRTYVPVRNKQGTISEESLDCPLAELDLIRYLPEDNIYRFNIGSKNSLPTAIFGYALLQYLTNIVQNRRTVAVEECIYHPGSPGQSFKLDENSVIEYIEALEELTAGHLRMQETAGLRQLYIDETLGTSLEKSAMDLLETYYARITVSG